MAVRLSKMWPPVNGVQKILIMQEGGVATFGEGEEERTIVQSPITENGHGDATFSNRLCNFW